MSEITRSLTETSYAQANATIFQLFNDMYRSFGLEPDEIMQVVSDVWPKVELYRQAAGLTASTMPSNTYNLSYNVNYILPNSERSRDLYRVLNGVFHFQRFRPLQEEIINCTIDNNDLLVVMPAGAGKSLLYQLPALYPATPGVTIVVCPLLSLMHDQIKSLQSKGIESTCLHSDQDAEERYRILHDLASPKPSFRLLYVTPERFFSQDASSPKSLIFALRAAATNGTLRRFVIDEAHCVTEWGCSFRPDYARLSILKKEFPKVPVMALTAAATKDVKERMLDMLNLTRNVYCFSENVSKANLIYEVRVKHNVDSIKDVISLLKTELAGQSGIIYCTKRKTTEKIAEALQEAGIDATAYHADMAGDHRKWTHDLWSNENVGIIVATVAFGMGIHKADVRFVIHYDMPSSLEGYYQETGRAGRDGLEARCILFYRYQDKNRHIYHILSDNQSELNKRVSIERLRKVIAFCEDTVTCRKRIIAHYFGQEAPERCGMCDNCRDTRVRELIDVTPIARMVTDTIRALDRHQSSYKYLIDVLIGSKRQEITDNEHDKLPHHGAVRDKFTLCHVIHKLIVAGVLHENTRIVQFNAVTVLELGPEFASFLRSETPMYITTRRPSEDQIKLKIVKEQHLIQQVSGEPTAIIGRRFTSNGKVLYKTVFIIDELVTETLWRSRSVLEAADKGKQLIEAFEKDLQVDEQVQVVIDDYSESPSANRRKRLSSSNDSMVEQPVNDSTQQSSKRRRSDNKTYTADEFDKTVSGPVFEPTIDYTTGVDSEVEEDARVPDNNEGHFFDNDTACNTAADDDALSSDDESDRDSTIENYYDDLRLVRKSNQPTATRDENWRYFSNIDFEEQEAEEQERISRIASQTHTLTRDDFDYDMRPEVLSSMNELKRRIAQSEKQLDRNRVSVVLWKNQQKSPTLDDTVSTGQAEDVVPSKIQALQTSDELKGLPFTLLWTIYHTVSHDLRTAEEILGNKPLLELFAQAQSEAAIKRCSDLLTTKKYILDEDIEQISAAIDSLNDIEDVRTHLEPKRLNVLVYRVTILDNDIRFLEPVFEKGNRLLREFPETNFIRVAFKVARSKRSNRQKAKKQIRKVLDEGIQIGSFRFEFLCFSASQLREHKAYFCLNNQRDFTPDKIRQWLGSFEHITNHAKYAARLGQSLSRTFPTIDVATDDIVIVPDIMDESGVFCFTDGCGTIPYAMARQVADILKLNSTPSAFQIRLGGSKGVLMVVTDDMEVRDTTIKQHCFTKICIRESMAKYQSHHTTLEICAWSEAIDGALNRQFILLLSNLGVPDDVFLRLQKQAIDSERRARDDMKELEKRVLSRKKCSSQESAYIGSIKCFYLAGQRTDDPFYRNTLLNIFMAGLKNIHSGRIPISSARFAIGVADVTQTLKEGEVYFKLGDSNIAIPTGKRVFVVKNPCLHPGDLRVLTARECPELAALSNVIVFPTVGTRPHPNEIAGSDLDGDQYLICWDDNLVPARSLPPAKYTIPPAPQQANQQAEAVTSQQRVSMKDVKEFFLEYPFNDRLGKISNAHLALADKFGVGYEPCLKLAELQSTAVDYAKTGVPASIPDDERFNPTEMPDYMELSHAPSYESTHILGQLYRLVSKEKELIAQELSRPSNVSPDPGLVREGHQKYLEEARKMHRIFCKEWKALWQEIERAEQSGQGGEVDVDEDEDELRNTRTQKKQEFDKRWQAKFREGVEHSDEEMKRKASAWYVAAYTATGKWKNRLWFPWVSCGDTLHNIKTKGATIAMDPSRLGGLRLV